MVGGRETRVDAVMDHILRRGPLSNPQETPEAAEFRGVTAAQAGCIKRTIGTRESWRWSKVVNIGRSHPSTPHLSSTLLLPPLTTQKPSLVLNLIVLTELLKKLALRWESNDTKSLMGK